MPNDREPLLQAQFQLAYYLGVTFRDFWEMPVADIRWHLDRLQKELTPQGKDDGPQPSRAMHMNEPEERALSGMTRAQAPARLMRFT